METKRLAEDVVIKGFLFGRFCHSLVCFVKLIQDLMLNGLDKCCAMKCLGKHNCFLVSRKYERAPSGKTWSTIRPMVLASRFRHRERCTRSRQSIAAHSGLTNTGNSVQT